MPQNVPVKSVRTTFRIIEALLDLKGASVSELTEHLNLPKSTIHDHLRTLQTDHYVINDDGEYRLSLRFLEIGCHSRQQKSIYQAAVSHIDELAHSTGEHVLLMSKEDGLGVILAISEGEQAVNIDSYPGMHVRLHTTAMGKCILAHLPKETFDRIIDHHGLPEVTRYTTTDLDELQSELDTICKQGYGIDRGGEIKGIKCIAVPIFQNNEIVASIGLCGPSNRIKSDYANEMREELLKTANVIEVTLNYA